LLGDAYAAQRDGGLVGGGEMSAPTLRERARYRVDHFMSRGGSSLVVSLVVVFLGLLALIMLLRVVLFVFVDRGGTEHNSFFETFLEMSDPGYLAQFSSAGRWFRLTAVLAMVFGVVFLSSLIAILTTSLDSRLAGLRRGHSKVLESDHTLILGWSQQRVVEVLKQLILANEFRAPNRGAWVTKRYAPIVILADRPKEEMDEFLALHVRNRKTTRIITRSGDPSDLVALGLVAATDAKSAIVLSGVTSTAPERMREAADAHVFKVLLALSTLRESNMNIVAEVMGSTLHGPAREIWPGRITTLCPADILAKILVETSRSIGLSAVYSQILSFEGSELYFYEADWNGATFGAIAYHFPDGVPIGLRTADGVMLNPAVERPMAAGDEVLILATDDSTIEFRPSPIVEPSPATPRTRRREFEAERQLLIGWTAKSRGLIDEYDDYVMTGSEIDVMVHDPSPDTIAEIEALTAGAHLERTTLNLLDLDPADPETWQSIEAGRYHNVVILADDDEEHAELIDAQTIMILFLVRGLLADATGTTGRPTNVITELVGSENEELARRAGVHDFVVSPNFVSMLLAQLSEEPDLYQVYEELFDPDGSEIYLKPVSLYFDALPITMPFADLMAKAQACGEVCLGFKVRAEETDAERNFGVHLVPEKTDRVTLGEHDRLVVLAVDES